MSEKDYLNMPIYIGREPGCGCITAACVDDPSHAKDTAEFVAGIVRYGRIVEHLTPEQWEEAKKDFRRCTHRQSIAKGQR